MYLSETGAETVIFDSYSVKCGLDSIVILT